MKDDIDSKQPEEQTGFRAGRSTVGNLIDLEKAYAGVLISEL